MDRFNSDDLMYQMTNAKYYYCFPCGQRACESTNSSYPFELISLAKEIVLSFHYYPEGSELLLSNSDLGLIYWGEASPPPNSVTFPQKIYRA